MKDIIEKGSSVLNNAISFIKHAPQKLATSLIKSQFGQNFIQQKLPPLIKTNVQPVVEDYIAALTKMEATEKDFVWKINGSHSSGIHFQNPENMVGMNFKLNKFNPTMNIEVEANVYGKENPALSIGMEYDWKVIPIPINIPMMRLETPVHGLIKAMYEHEGKTLTVSGGLRGGKMMECTANLCIGNPITIGGAIGFDLGWVNASIQVKHKGMQLNGGWAKNNELGFYIQMEHSPDVEESVSKFGVIKPGYEYALNTQMEVSLQGEGKILNKKYKLKRVYCRKGNQFKLQWVIDM